MTTRSKLASFVMLLMCVSYGLSQEATTNKPPDSAPGARVVIAPQIDLRRKVPLPEYPSGARRRAAQGVTLLKVYVLESGQISEVTVAISSGHSDLDEAAVRSMWKWKFLTGTMDGKPTAMWTIAPIIWRIADAPRKDLLIRIDKGTKEARQMQDEYMKSLASGAQP